MADWSDVDEPTDAFPRMVGKRYVMERPLGGDHVATTFLAIDAKSNQQVTVRLMLESAAQDEAHCKRFLEGGRIMSEINHPHVLSVTDFGEWEGIPFLVTEHIDGVSLQQAMQKGFAFSEIEACDIALDLLTALSQVHRRGCVHRGVHPAAILLEIDGTALLGDFGVALLDPQDDEDTSPDVFGELGYAPDELRGDPSSAGAEADIYSVGALLYAMVADRSPVDLALGPARRKEALEQIPAMLRPVIHKATQFQPDDRHHSCHEMVLDLVPVRDDIARSTNKPAKGNEWLRWFHTLTPGGVPMREVAPSTRPQVEQDPTKKIIKRRQSQPLATATRRPAPERETGANEAIQPPQRSVAMLMGGLTLMLLAATAYVMWG